jgi:hypothetical protein
MPRSPGPRSTISLTNPIYTGRVRHHGGIYSGEHERIVGERIWNQVQKRLKRDDQRAAKKHDSLRLLRCGHDPYLRKEDFPAVRPFLFLNKGCFPPYIPPTFPLHSPSLATAKE